MAKGARMSAQRESARKTIRDRESGRSRDRNYRSQGSSYTDRNRAADNRNSAADRDAANKASQAAAAAKAKAAAEAAAKAKAAKELAAKKAQARINVSATQADIKAQAQKNVSAFQEGFTQQSKVETVGDMAGAVFGAPGKIAVEAGSRIASAVKETDHAKGFGAQGWEGYGKKVAKETGITSSGLVNTGLSAAAGMVPGLGIVETAAKHKARVDTVIQGPDGPVNAYVGGEVPQARQRESSNDKVVDTITTPTQTPESVTPTQVAPVSNGPSVKVESFSPGIGLSTGTHTRAPNFVGSIVIGGRGDRRKRGRI